MRRSVILDGVQSSVMRKEVLGLFMVFIKW
jgi:hypothetical protein